MTEIIDAANKQAQRELDAILSCRLRTAYMSA